MAYQVLDTRQKSPTEQITKGLSSGLIQYLDNAAESKLKEIDRQRTAMGLEGVGFEPAEAKGLSQLPEGLQKEIVKDQYASQREGAKGSQKIVRDIVSGEKAAKDNLTALNRIEQLDKKGNVQGLGGEILKKVGLGRFRTADTQELEKLTIGMLRDLKSIFGSRPTNFDTQQYLNAIPNLLQSPEGRERVIRNLKATNEAAKIRADALREILKENRNRVPANVDLLIEDRVGDQLDRLNAELSGSAEGQQGGSDQLPDPAQYAGKKIKDTQTGQILVSNGREWVPA